MADSGSRFSFIVKVRQNFTHLRIDLPGANEAVAMDYAGIQNDTWDHLTRLSWTISGDMDDRPEEVALRGGANGGVDLLYGVDGRDEPIAAADEPQGDGAMFDGVVVKAFHDEVVIHESFQQAGMIGHMSGDGDLVQAIVGRRGFAFTFSQEMTMVMASGETFQATGIAIEKEIASVNFVEIRGVNVPPFTISRTSPTVSDEEVRYRRSDANVDGTVNIADPVRTLHNLFLGVGALHCLDAADSNDDGKVDISDATKTLHYLFRGGDALPAPGPAECGVDPTDDDLGCETYEVCE